MFNIGKSLAGASPLLLELMKRQNPAMGDMGMMKPAVEPDKFSFGRPNMNEMPMQRMMGSLGAGALGNAFGSNAGPSGTMSDTMNKAANQMNSMGDVPQQMAQPDALVNKAQDTHKALTRVKNPGLLGY
jgi:hypothetical protein